MTFDMRDAGWFVDVYFYLEVVNNLVTRDLCLPMAAIFSASTIYYQSGILIYKKWCVY